MKWLVKYYVIIVMSLFVVDSLIPGITIIGNLPGLFLSALVYMLLAILVKPIIKIILIPLRLLTFGLASFLTAPLIFYGTFRIVPFLSLSDWMFPGFTSPLITVPEVAFGIIATYIISGLILEFLITILRW